VHREGEFGRRCGINDECGREFGGRGRNGFDGFRSTGRRKLDLRSRYTPAREEFGCVDREIVHGAGRRLRMTAFLFARRQNLRGRQIAIGHGLV
jgi:hypothetical protein